MLFKIIFSITSKESTTHIYKIANMSLSKYDIKILKESVLEKFAVCLKSIAFSHQFIVRSDQDGRLMLSFDKVEIQEGETMCNVPCQVFNNGDLK